MISFSLKERGEVGTLENTCTWAPFFFGFPSLESLPICKVVLPQGLDRLTSSTRHNAENFKIRG